MVNIKGIYNIVANVISRLDYSLTIDDKADWTTFMHCWCHYTMHIESVENTYIHQEQINLCLLIATRKMLFTHSQ